MDNVINWPLLKHPLNWLTVILMVMIAGAALHFVLAHWKNQTGTAE
jgi:Mg2+ and Co2+ transporter CorA